MSRSIRFLRGEEPHSKRSQLLVLVAPIQGLSEAPWGKEFLKVSDSVGVKLSEGRRGPLLPRLLPSGEWSGRVISAPESSVWLNGLLEKGLGAAPTEGLTSHGSNHLELDD